MNFFMTFTVEEAKRILRERFPTAIELRKAHPDFAHLMQGEFARYFNIYNYTGKNRTPNSSGIVVSRSLLQGRDSSIPKGKNPTVGLIDVGHYVFDTGGCIEELTVLEIMGNHRLGHNRLIALDGSHQYIKTSDEGRKHFSVLGRHAGITSTSGSLSLSADSPVICLRRYRTPEERAHVPFGRFPSYP